MRVKWEGELTSTASPLLLELSVSPHLWLGYPSPPLDSSPMGCTPPNGFYVLFETGSCYVAWAGLKLEIPLPQLPEC
jgi:hypothetical protein